MSDASILFPNLGIVLRNVGQELHVFGFRIAYYGIAIAAAMLAGVHLSLFLAKKSGQREEDYLDLSLLAIVFALVGARLYYVIFSWEDYRENPLEIFNFRGGGLAIYGGILAGTATVWAVCRKKKLSFWKVTDTVCPGLALGQAIGRWGNFFNREVFGGYTDNLLAMALPVRAVREADVTQEMAAHLFVRDGVTFLQAHPTFLYESLWNVGLLALLLWLFRRAHLDGNVFLAYLAGYGAGRAWIEGIRTDRLLIPGTGIAVSQALSVILVVVCAGALLVRRRRRASAHFPRK